MAIEVEARELQPEVQRHRILPLAVGGVRGGQERRRDELDRARRVDPRKGFSGQGLADPGGLAQLAGDDVRGDRRAQCTVAPADLVAGRLEDDRVRGNAVALRDLEPRRAPVGIEPGRVHDRGQAAGQPLGHDEVEHLERVAAGPHIALAGADDGAQALGGDDLVGMEELARPVRLARAARPDEHDEAGVGQPQHDLTRNGAARSWPATTLAGTGAPLARLRSRTTFGAVSRTIA